MSRSTSGLLQSMQSPVKPEGLRVNFARDPKYSLFTHSEIVFRYSILHSD